MCFAAASYWMGLSDEFIENEYTWIDTDTPLLEFTDWFPGEPNDNSKDSEDCVLFWDEHDFLWNDGACSLGIQAVCEVK